MEVALQSSPFFQGVEYLAIFCCGLVGGLAHRRANAPQVVHRESFFENHSQAEPLGNGAARGHVVHRAAHRQAPYVASGEEVRGHHERVGGECQPRCLRG